MTFAEALARIESILSEDGRTEGYTSKEYVLRQTLREHADSIVQLGKVAKEMRASVDDDTGRVDPNDWLFASGHYDKLLNGEEG